MKKRNPDFFYSDAFKAADVIAIIADERGTSAPRFLRTVASLLREEAKRLESKEEENAR